MAARILAHRYELVEPLGSGAMATVWRAHDGRLDRDVAIKVLSEQLAADAAFRERFELEAVHVAALKHPNIVTVYDSGGEDGSFYIIMELVEGQSLQSRLKERSPYMTIAETRRLGDEVLSGLGHAHETGIIHRDIKPANILIARDDTAKLADFGIARAAGDAQQLTTTGSFIGTPAYSSPEQLSGRPATAATDLYSFGCVLYQCLLGHPPFEAEIPVGVIGQHMQTEPRPMRPERAEIPPPLEAAVMRALEKDPERRFASAGQMRESLSPSAADGETKESLSTVVKAGPSVGAEQEPAQPAKSRRWRLGIALSTRRWRLSVVLTAAAAVVAAGLVIPLALGGGGGQTTSASRPPAGGSTASTGASDTSAANAALQPLLAQWQNSVTSGPVESPTGLLAVIAHDTTSVSSTATVYSFTSGKWNVLSSQDLGYSIMTGTPVVSGNVTGGQAPDFLVTQEAGSMSVGSVLSSVSGSWQVVPFRTSSGVANEVQDLHFTDGHPVSQQNTCTPSCAAGNQTAVFYNYDATTRQFVPQQ